MDLTDEVLSRAMDRRRFMELGAVGAGLTALTFAGCASANSSSNASSSGAVASVSEGTKDYEKPSGADPDPDSPFGVDRNINMNTIDSYINNPDVAYRDMRMLLDPADYEAIGGRANLEFVIPGFKIVPYPYIGTMQQLPVDGAYAGRRLYDIDWGDDGHVKTATPLFEQSRQIIDDLFPNDKPLFLMCGGGGYANMMRMLLIYLGWDETQVYNVGGQWEYAGDNLTQLISYDTAGNASYMFWRADYAQIDFSTLTPL